MEETGQDRENGIPQSQTCPMGMMESRAGVEKGIFASVVLERTSTARTWILGKDNVAELRPCVVEHSVLVWLEV